MRERGSSALPAANHRVICARITAPRWSARDNDCCNQSVRWVGGQMNPGLRRVCGAAHSDLLHMDETHIVVGTRIHIHIFRESYVKLDPKFAKVRKVQWDTQKEYLVSV